MANEAYMGDLLAYFDKNLPARIYDAHAHVTRAFAARTGYSGEPFDQYIESYEEALGRRMNEGMVMTQPSSRHTRETLADDNAYNMKLARERGFAAGHIITPEDRPEEVAAILDAHPEIRVLKPYLTYTVAKDRYESDIVDFAPEWMFSLAAERRMPILIHLSHYGDMLNDENNIRDIRYLSRKYPDAKIVLAHCAMGHHVRKLRLGLPKILDLDNIWFDCSGASETMAVYYCLQAFGVSRMMWGSDHDFGVTPGRICSFGTNFLGLHPGYLKSLPGDYRYEPLLNVTECTMALLEAAELLSLGKSDLEAIFYDNAKAMYG